MLCFFAHPDDETLAAGGTISRFIREGHEVFLALPFTGVYARGNNRYRSTLNAEYASLQRQVDQVTDHYGIAASHVWLDEFPDNQADERTLLDLIQWIEPIITEVKPDWVYTHHRFCTNIDHQYCHQAAVVACRPAPDFHPALYSAEVPSSTGYLRPTGFEPNMYVGIEKQDLEAKVRAMEMYAGECREDPHPRSRQVLEALAKVRGSESGFMFAEAFMATREYACDMETGTDV